MIKKLLCQLELRDCPSYREQQKTLANYHVKCHGRFLCSFTYPWIFQTGNLPLESLVTHTNTISSVKGSFTTVKVSRVTSPIESQRGMQGTNMNMEQNVQAMSKTCEHGLTCHCFQFLSRLWRALFRQPFKYLACFQMPRTSALHGSPART